MSKPPQQYVGKDAAVTWNGALCIHMGECGRAKGDLFVSGRQPWCQPDVTTTADVVAVVERCPTGALTYSVPGTDEATGEEHRHSGQQRAALRTRRPQA